MRAPTSIDVETSSPPSLVTLRGEHDVGSWTDVAFALAAAGAQSTVLVDLSECTFMDSTVITALLVAAKQLHARDGALEVFIPADAVAIRRTLELMNVDAMLSTHETREAAVASLAAKAVVARTRRAA